VIYLDSCAIIKLILTEQHTNELFAYLAEHNTEEHVSSQLADAEVRRALKRHNASKGRPDNSTLLRQHLAHADQLFTGSISLLTLNFGTIATAGAYDEPQLRTLDALHLASAEKIRSVLSAFISYDNRLEQVAKIQGFPTVRPGA
jgi:uncharacterized protein